MNVEERFDRMVRQLKSLDLTIEYWLDKSENEFMCITTLSDISTGIFPFDVSPKFRTQTELVNWWENIVNIFNIEC